MLKKRSLMLAAALLATTAVAAVTRIPGTNTYYERSFDPMTDENRSFVALQEINDTEAQTVLIFICRDGGVNVFLNTKHDLLTMDDYDNDTGPNIMYRVDTQQPKTIPSGSASQSGEPDLTAVAFDSARSQILLTAFKNATSKVAVRVLRTESSPLDYTFSAKGFKDAMKAVNNCQ